MADSENADRTDALIEEALLRHDSGEDVLVLVESPNGSLGNLRDRLLREGPVLSHVVCASSCQADPGGLAEVIDLDVEDPGSILVENAQWADPTSLGHIQRMLQTGGKGHLVVLAHTPMSDIEGWGLNQLALSAGHSGHMFSVSVDTGSENLADIPLDGPSIDLVAACSLMTRPVPVPEAARVLSIPEEEIFEIGHRLVSLGVLREGRGGFAATPTGTSAVMTQEARLGRIAGRLADELEKGDAPPAVVGNLRFDAGQYQKALDLLTQAAVDASNRHETGEAFRLATRALEAAENADAGNPDDLGTMHLLCAGFLRSAGRTEWAIEHAEKAASIASGPARIQSLSLAATLADDSQRPQDAERLIAIAEWESVRVGDDESLATLLAFRARVLNRVGFAEEADETLYKAENLAATAISEAARFEVQTNRAWIHFDRGEMARAEIEFSHLRDQANRFGGQVSIADKEAWRARSLLPSGHPEEAIEAITAAEEIARTEGVEAPIFLSDLAMAEGAIAYGRHDEALAASERALDLVVRQLPAWENMALATRARVHIAAGNYEDAKADIDRALELSPNGANGWRWRTRCQALMVEADGASGEWREAEAEDVADRLLQSKLYGWASEALCVVAEHGGRQAAAADAMTLALTIGQPMLAARAAHAGVLWNDQLSAGAILGAHAVDHRVPAEWRDRWEELPHIAAALAAPAPEEDPGLEAATARLNSALASAGLSGEATTLSPAQRRSTGLVAGHRTSRARRGLWAVAAALGVVLVAALTALGVSQFGQDPQEVPVTLAEASTPTTAAVEIPLEETQIAVPDAVDFFFGTSVYRGAYDRSGLVEVSGPREVNGYYWRFQTAGPIQASPVVFGTTVYVGTTEGTFFALDQTTGNEIWTMAPEGRIGAAPALGQGEMEENQSPMMVVIVDDDGTVRGHDAAVATGVQWTTRLDTRIRSSPVVVDGRVYLAANDGFVYALDLIGGNELWRYPGEDPGLGPISADLAFHNGILYVGTEEGRLHLIDVSAETPTQICEYDAIDPIVTSPIVTEDVAYVGTMGNSIWPLLTGQCDDNVPGRLPAYVTDTPVTVGPAIVGDTMYVPAGRFLYSIDLTTGEHMWPGNTVTVGAPISTPPVVTADTVYFASEDGGVYAVDATTGEALWEWETGLHVRAAPAVVDGVVFVAGGDGYLYALGP